MYTYVSFIKYFLKVDVYLFVLNQFNLFSFQDNIPDSSLRKLKKYIDNPNFLPEIAEKSSKVLP